MSTVVYYKTNELYHHGIAGQKWGVRNGPPYPLKAGDHSAREKKAGWKKSLSGRHQYAPERIARNAAHTVAHPVKAVKEIVKHPIKTSPEYQTAKYIANDVKHLLAKKQNNTPNKAGLAAEVTLGLSYMAALMAAYGVGKAINAIAYSHDKKSNIKKNDATEFKKITAAHSADSDMKAINKGYESGLPEYRMNCTMCSASYELRRRGYDVQANTTTMGRKIDDAAAWFGIDKTTIPKHKTYDEFVSAISKEPEGSRGSTFTGYGAFDSYHCMVWEKTGGKVIIRDCQNGKKYSSIEASPINRHSRIRYSYYRTDDKEINFDAIKDAVKNRSNG